jgi:hypothetical protein
VSVALAIQHAMRMRHAILSSVACPVLPYFSKLSHKGHDIRKKKSLCIKCVSWFSVKLPSEIFLILTRIQRGTIINVHRSSCKLPVFLSDFNEIWIFSTDYRKILKFQISWKSVQWDPSCSMRTDRRINMTNLRVTFRNFAKTPTHEIISYIASLT